MYSASMPRLNVYVPNDLARDLAACSGLNVSAICQKALREHLRSLSTMGKLSERFEVDVEGPNGIRTVAFRGRRLAGNGDGFAVYITAGERIVVATERPGAARPSGLDIFQNLSQAAAEGVPSTVIEDARAEFSRSEPVEELDI